MMVVAMPVGQLIVAALLNNAARYAGVAAVITDPYCNGNGVLHANFTCSCFSTYTGPTCLRRVCPSRKAWADIASADHTAHADFTECSNMGTCDRTTGTCACRAGFVGPACERMACPYRGKLECSGRGRCTSMSQAASDWDGLSLIRPNVEYSSVHRWDADMIYGCVCDYGYSGYDCSQRKCPTGDDPLTTGQQNEIMRLVCQANSGSFTFSFGGFSSAEIPYNASWGYLEYLLEDLTSIRDVEVSFSTGDVVCGGTEEVTTTIEFMQEFGDLPPAKVTTTDLSSAMNDDVTLALETLYVIGCSTCPPPCYGGIYIGFEGAMTGKIAWNASGSDVQTELESLSTFGRYAAYGNSSYVNVSISPTTGGGGGGGGGWLLCDGAVDTYMTIGVRAQYGNMPNITVINSIYSGWDLIDLNYTFPTGTKENVVCSNHGTCDFATGTCTCARNLTYYPNPGDWYYWDSSDGYGGPGSRGDCGWRRVTKLPRESSYQSSWNTSLTCPSTVTYLSPRTPSYDTQLTAYCSGYGTCNNVTGGCDCYPGRFGHDCTQVRCPTGKAWFDEAYADNAAHAPGAECSSRGLCDYSTGTCKCQTGFEGVACQRMACDDGCGDFGRCLPMYLLARHHQQMGGGEDGMVVYGEGTNYVPWGQSVYVKAATWDFDMVHGCLCDSRDRYQPRTGPSAFVSGKWTEKNRLSGHAGHKCQYRTCATGDNVMTTAGQMEVQTIQCTVTSGTFTLTFRGRTTKDIDAATANETDVKVALQALSTIGQIAVNVTSGSSWACDNSFAAGEGIMVTFLTELGDLPLITASPDMYVNETVKGTKEDNECGDNGYCNFNTGLCECNPGYFSSDGSGNFGTRGDCSYRYTDYTTQPVDIFEYLKSLQ